MSRSKKDLEPPSDRDCDWCDLRPARIKCEGCPDQWWCSEQCQADGEDSHVRHCDNPIRPLTTADRLADACFMDCFPEDPQTNEDFFFNNAKSARDRTQILGLYQGLIKYCEVKPSTVHKWRIEGTLVENIKSAFEAPSHFTAGSYYAWFLQNQDLFQPKAKSLILRPSKPDFTCAACGKAAHSHCACAREYYCGRVCQKKRWIIHIVDCDPIPGRPLCPADYLGAAIRSHKTLEDPEARRCYGIEATLDPHDQTMLYEVYRLILDAGIKPRRLEDWRKAGRLSEEMTEVLRQSTQRDAPVAVDWLQRHKHIFDPEYDEQSNASDVVERHYLALWAQLGGSPTFTFEDAKLAVSAWPEHKATCFQFYVMGELGGNPSPNFVSWVNFGYCACHEEDEGFLGLTYNMLRSRCSFDNFLAAYSSSTIAALMDKHGLRSRRIIHPFLEDVLAGSPNMFKSVWYLKQFVVDSSSTRAQLPRSVWWDYGFVNCKKENDLEYKDLRMVYKELLERKDANPLHLHEACIGGKLFAYVSRFIPRIARKKQEAKKYQRLMKNVYPLALPVENI